MIILKITVILDNLSIKWRILLYCCSYVFLNPTSSFILPQNDAKTLSGPVLRIGRLVYDKYLAVTKQSRIWKR